MKNQMSWAAVLGIFLIVTSGYGQGKLCGDCNGDYNITIADAICIIGYIYRGGHAPRGSGDVNVDGRVTSADAVYLVGYIYRGGPEP